MVGLVLSSWPGFGMFPFPKLNVAEIRESRKTFTHKGKQDACSFDGGGSSR